MAVLRCRHLRGCHPSHCSRTRRPAQRWATVTLLGRAHVPAHDRFVVAAIGAEAAAVAGEVDAGAVARHAGEARTGGAGLCAGRGRNQSGEQGQCGEAQASVVTNAAEVAPARQADEPSEEVEGHSCEVLGLTGAGK